MTRINTNVPSFVAQNRLNRSSGDLQETLTRLSTGLRINSGKDDPAGLIASEALRSEITSITKAISNTNRANQIITTADSALGQVSSLLNDVRGLVVEAANSGALSDDEIAANQLQIDSSLEAINRIAQTTTFQGRKLLDGSLDFVSKSGTNFGNIKSLQIDQANLGASGKVDVNIDIQSAATKASLDIAGFLDPVDGTSATADLDIGAAVTGVEASADVTFAGETFTVETESTGTQYNGTTITFADAGVSGATTAAYDADTNTITVSYDVTTGGATSVQVAAAIDGLDGFAVNTAPTSAAVAANAALPADVQLADGVDANTASTITVTSPSTGIDDNVAITYIDGGSASTAPTAAINETTGALEVTYNFADSVSSQSIQDAINTIDGYTATGGSATSFTTAGVGATGATLAGGVAQIYNGVQADAVFELAGKNGSEVFNVTRGTTLAQLVDQINLVSDATGITAERSGTTLQLRSSEYGRESVVDLRVISEADGGNFGNGARATGTDVKATINGRSANSIGNDITLNTATLDLKISLAADQTESSSFSITGGGALFQLGADVVSNQQARIGLQSVSSARLGGVAGKLFELGSGESASLTSDPNKAARIVTEAINQVTSLRGRLGAFQATTLESNQISLNDTVANLQEAESSIRDADFAKEAARLTRAQILVQSGTTVLQQANQNPQSVLSLLR